jgi:CRISPR type III-A-associated protein Csm2
MKEKAGSRRQGASAPATAELHSKFDAYLKRLRETGYFDDKGNLRATLRVEDADTVAQVLAGAGVTAGQLRHFFTMARSLEQRLGVSHNFAGLVPEIASLQPFTALIIGRAQTDQVRERLKVLREFIDTNAQLARTSEQAFRNGFLPHFESVICYFTLYKPK